ncbi:hypothetical protein [Marinifilum sp. D737]|uniref:hypothetical protein n=1 Tax=Marinifilum sp. D737 TaxID=2969628 RepID=UPI0022729FFB|nr:hypothetical protein [Marinifilum sp. D737]MCY1635848.1 hypothetical protein [Marinifilum sp. D737]
MKKIIFCTIILLLGLYSFGQVCKKKLEPPLILSGKCVFVLNQLKDHFKNDSIAVDYFKTKYFIIQEGRYTKCTFKTQKCVEFFTDPKNKNLKCILKKRVYEDTLLE